MKLFTWKALFLMYKSFLWKFDCSLKNAIVAYGGPIWLMLSFARARRIVFINFISHIILSIAMIIAIVTIIIISLTGTFTYHRQFRFLLIVSLPFMVTLKNVEFSYEEYEYSIIFYNSSLTGNFMLQWISFTITIINALLLLLFVLFVYFGEEGIKPASK